MIECTRTNESQVAMIQEMDASVLFVLTSMYIYRDALNVTDNPFKENSCRVNCITDKTGACQKKKLQQRN